jgi:hypothetical protein
VYLFLQICKPSGFGEKSALSFNDGLPNQKVKASSCNESLPKQKIEPSLFNERSPEQKG